VTDVLVAENIVGKAMDQLRQEHDVAFEPDLWQSPEKLHKRVRDAVALVVRNQTQVTAELIANAPQLKVIARAGAGLDNIDTQAATDAGVIVTYAKQENALSVAELTIGFMLALARQISAADRDTRAGGWNRQQFVGVELSGKTLGVVGLGRIGTLVAWRAKAFGMTIVAHDDFVDPQSDHVRALDARLMTLDQLLAESDFVSCHVPLTEQTRGMFNYSRFCQMKSSSMFLNASRGEVVDEAGLIRALHENQIAGAALDVREKEPPAPSPLTDFDNVLLTPHIAAFTDEAQQRVVKAICHDVSAVLRGEPTINHSNFSRPRLSDAS